MSQEQTVSSIGEISFKAKLEPDPTAPIVYLIHGRAGNYDVMWTFKRTIPEYCSIVAPQATVADPVGGFSWWQVQPVLADRSTANNAARTVLDFIKSYETKHNLQPKMRLALGFSQGAALLSLALQQEPEYFAGIGLLAGFVIEYGDAPVLSSNQPKIFMAHGTEDQVIPIEKAHKSRDRLLGWGLQVEFHEDPVGHKVGAPTMRALATWLQKCISN